MDDFADWAVGLFFAAVLVLIGLDATGIVDLPEPSVDLPAPSNDAVHHDPWPPPPPPPPPPLPIPWTFH